MERVSKAIAWFRRGSQRGQAVTEFALVVPLLALVLLSLTELGFMLNNRASMANAARNGARTAASEPDLTLLTTDVQNAAVASANERLVNCLVSVPTSIT